MSEKATEKKRERNVEGRKQKGRQRGLMGGVEREQSETRKKETKNDEVAKKKDLLLETMSFE